MKEHFGQCIAIVEDDLSIEEVTDNMNMKNQQINLRRMYYKIAQCHEILCRTEQYIGETYDYIIRIRPDVEVMKKLTFEKIKTWLDKSDIALEVADFEERILSDQFAITTRSSMDKYASLYNNITNYEKNPLIRDGGAHSILYDHLYLNGVNITRMPFVRGKYMNASISDMELLDTIDNNPLSLEKKKDLISILNY